MFIILWDVNELARYSQTVGHGVSGVVCCVVVCQDYIYPGLRRGCSEILPTPRATLISEDIDRYDDDNSVSHLLYSTVKKRKQVVGNSLLTGFGSVRAAVSHDEQDNLCIEIRYAVSCQGLFSYQVRLHLLNKKDNYPRIRTLMTAIKG